jgi:hypothetical protein
MSYGISWKANYSFKPVDNVTLIFHDSFMVIFTSKSM